MVLSPKQKTMIFVGVSILIVVVVAGLVAMHMMKPVVKNASAPASASAPVSVVAPAPILNPVPAGQIPIDGKEFVVASALTGKYVADNNVMTTDINDAKVFTYNSTSNHTNEEIKKSDGTSETISVVPSGQKALIVPGNNEAYAFIVSGDNWNDSGTITYNIPAALDNYYSAYGVKLFYVSL